NLVSLLLVFFGFASMPQSYTFCSFLFSTFLPQAYLNRSSRSLPVGTMLFTRNTSPSSESSTSIGTLHSSCHFFAPMRITDHISTILGSPASENARSSSPGNAARFHQLSSVGVSCNFSISCVFIILQGL